MTITMDEVVYEGLVRVVGRRKISAFLEGLARPHVIDKDLAEGYKAMGLDAKRGKEALDWSEALIGDASHAVGRSVVGRF
jgi:hypothetical protein